MNANVCMSLCPDVRDFSRAHLFAMGAINLVLIPVTVVSNCVVLGALVKTKSIGAASQFFAVALCINDLLIGLTLQPLGAAYLLFKELQDSCTVRWAIQSLSYSLVVLDLLMICCMAIERYIVLRYSLSQLLLRWLAVKRYVFGFDVAFAVSCSAASVLVAMFTSFSYLFSLVCQIIAIAMVAVISVSYTLAYMHVRRSVTNLAKQPHSGIHVSNQRLRHDVALGRSLAIILGTGFALYLPLALSEILWTLILYDSRLSMDAKTVTLFLTWSFIPVYLNSSINVYIYAYYNRPVRKYISKRICPFFKTCIGTKDAQRISYVLKDRNV